MSYATARSALVGLHPSIDEENQTALLVAADAVDTSEDLGAFLGDVDTSETTQVAELFTALAEEIGSPAPVYSTMRDCLSKLDILGAG